MNQMFTNREVPWMRLGTVIDHDVNAAEAAKLGGLDFTVEARRLRYESAPDVWTDVQDRVANVRTNTGHKLGIVSNDYVPVQYTEAFDFMDGINPRYVAAGALNGGRQAFMVVQLPEREHLNLDILGEEDPHSLYAILRTSHDLSKAIELALMTLRHRCMNQLTLPSFATNAVQRWSIRHVGQPIAKLRAAQDVILKSDRYVEQVRKTARRLAEVELELTEAEDLIRSVLPDRPRRDEQVNAITRAWRESPRVGFSDNGWGLTNAVSEYFEWQRNSRVRTSLSRFNSGLVGDAHRYVGRTAQLLLAR